MMPVKTATTGLPAAAAAARMHSARASVITPTVGSRVTMQQSMSSRSSTVRTSRASRGSARDCPSSRLTSASWTMTCRPFCPAESATTEASATELETTARPLPPGIGCDATIWAISMSSSLVRTRMTPDWRSIASTAAVGACVVRTACPGGRRRPITSDLATITGLERESLRAMRENLRGLPKDSRYRPTARVPGSSSQNCMASLPETSARWPAETKEEMPMERREAAAYSSTPIAADWLKSPSEPRLGMPGATEALSRIPGSVLTRPREAGPITRMPLARARWTRSRWRARPCSPSCSKPPVTTSRPLTPAAAQSSMTPRTSSWGTAMTARSTGPGISRTVA